MGTIRDRGLVIWQSALIMPKHKVLNKKIGEVDYFLNKKLIIDEYQVEEFENNIHYAMEYHLPISFKLHNKGNPYELYGHCVYIHPYTKELRIQKKDSSFEYIKFDEIIDVIVED
ncbi:YolD-like family protein [Peribacillus frigoritolerans]|uniref:YolD-like family protein n=1 Tax=Peribacillus frigoritolerans TaxID=450367 RepID=UPI001EFE68A3|nr:YolD-like family protein [Peribacillus frigoritolerans]ULM98822.1 YolD-like family protein [Peribacillus frigoritolerans]